MRILYSLVIRNSRYACKYTQLKKTRKRSPTNTIWWRRKTLNFFAQLIPPSDKWYESTHSGRAGHISFSVHIDAYPVQSVICRRHRALDNTMRLIRHSRRRFFMECNRQLGEVYNKFIVTPALALFITSGRIWTCSIGSSALMRRAASSPGIPIGPTRSNQHS